MAIKWWCMAVFVSVVVAQGTGISEARPRCVKCHSENPKVRAMHEMVADEDCFGCHVRGEKLRRKGGIPKEKHEAFLRQRRTDGRCVRCHGEGRVRHGHIESGNGAMGLSGTSYCPKCRVKGDGDWKMCPKCGGPLLDLDLVMRRSALSADDKWCRQCHFMEGSLEAVHIQRAGGEFRADGDCLECHEGHKACSGCHE